MDNKNFKINSQHEAEIGKFFHPKTNVVTVLPDVKSVKDLAEILLDKKDGTYEKHQMINGAWKKGTVYS